MEGVIINPWWFYLIDFLGNLEVAAGAAIFVSLGVFGVIIIYYMSDEWTAIMKKVLNISICVFIVSCIVNIVIPSKETMYTMMVASYVTYENVDYATDTIKDSVDYIFDKFNEDEQ